MRPYSIVQQTEGGSYILQEMNGAIMGHKVAAFRLIPFHKRSGLQELASEPSAENSDQEDLESPVALESDKDKEDQSDPDTDLAEFNW